MVRIAWIVTVSAGAEQRRRAALAAIKLVFNGCCARVMALGQLFALCTICGNFVQIGLFALIC